MNEDFDEFDNYALTFDMSEEGIEYKYNHSYRVVHQAEELCRSLELDTVERDLASQIALLHDIARFRQWAEFKTFDDNVSFDHGLEGAKILFDEGLVKKFKINEEDYEIVKKAIINHNKFKLDVKGFNEREILHSKIIRDADKVDILYALSTNKLWSIQEDDNEIDENVSDDFMHHREIIRKDIHSKNDRILMLIGLVYDLNYDYSKERVLNEGYITKIYDNLKHKKRFKKYVDEAIKYLKGDK